MLVLGRKRGESFVMTIANLEITVRVLKVIGPQVKIGIDAPRAVQVLRTELKDDGRGR